MKATESTVHDMRDEILRISQMHGATRVRLFGSFARGTAHSDSDLDLLIDLDPNRDLLDVVAIKQDLEELLGRQVHVVTEAAINRRIRGAVLKDAVPL